MIKTYAQLIIEKLTWIPMVVTYVWMCLIAVMFLVLYLVQEKPHGLSSEGFWVLILILATMTYPVYSLGYQLIPGFIGNTCYTVLLAFVIYKVYKKKPVAALLLSPIAIWVTIASIYTIARLINYYS